MDDELHAKVSSLEKYLMNQAAAFTAMEGMVNALIATHPDKGALLQALNDTYEGDLVTELFGDEEVQQSAEEWREVWRDTVRSLGSGN